MAVIPRVVVGPRANGDIGVFSSPAGVNADTAGDASLTLSITSKVSQLIAMGRVFGNTTLALGLSRSPHVFVTSQFDFSGIVGHSYGPGPVRPSPPRITGVSGSYAVINSNGASITIGVGTYPTLYQIWGLAFT